jgi:signal transduction histidine kinase
MGVFFWGMAAGGLSALAILGLAAIPAYRRFVRFYHRAQQTERLAELGTLTGGLAHEIKNPLSTVQLNLQLLQEDLDPHNTRLSSRMNTIQREVSRLRDILDDFLRYAGKLELSRQPISLKTLLEDLVDFFTPQAQLQRVQLRLKTPESDVVANIDPRLIKQTVLNLMINALQAMPGGGELILSLSETPTVAVIDIIDTGSGISPEALDKIFQAYYSTKKGGTGLGLAMAQRIAKEHGGALTVSSEVGKGSNFRLELPK